MCTRSERGHICKDTFEDEQWGGLGTKSCSSAGQKPLEKSLWKSNHRTPGWIGCVGVKEKKPLN